MLDNNKLPTKLLWVDLEMTGLNPEKDVILEVSAKVTDFDLKILSSYQAIIYQPKNKLKNLDKWVVEHHTNSGLFKKIENGKKEQVVTTEIVEFIKSNFKNELAILAGNSIHFDRNFIKKHWRKVDKLLHYRMLDVSSFKIWMQGKKGLVFNKSESHRADDDIKESIQELRYYLNWFKENK